MVLISSFLSFEWSVFAEEFCVFTPPSINMVFVPAEGGCCLAALLLDATCCRCRASPAAPSASQTGMDRCVVTLANTGENQTFTVCACVCPASEESQSFVQKQPRIDQSRVPQPDASVSSSSFAHLLMKRRLSRFLNAILTPVANQWTTKKWSFIFFWHLV